MMQNLMNSWALIVVILGILILDKTQGNPPNEAGNPPYRHPQHLEEECEKTEDCEQPLECYKGECTCKSQICTCEKLNQYWYQGECLSRAEAPCNPKNNHQDCVPGAKCIDHGRQSGYGESGTCECTKKEMYNKRKNLCNLAGSLNNSGRIGVLFSMLPAAFVGLFIIHQ